MKTQMKLVIATAFLTISMAISSFAGEWYEEKSGRKLYIKDNGLVAANEWLTIDGVNYFFNGIGFLVEDPALQFSGLYFEEGNFPLEHLRDDFVVDSRGVLMGRWSRDYIWDQHPEAANTMINWSAEKKFELPEEYQSKEEYAIHQQTSEYEMQDAIATNRLSHFSYQGGDNMLAMAKLAGVKFSGYQHMINDPKMLELAQAIEDFLNSFDWKNASEFEKAVRISEKVNEAEYFNDTTKALNDLGQEYPIYGDSYDAYGCLVKKKCVCQGYAEAAMLLATCVDLDHGAIVVGNHVYPIYKINGIWLSQDPTRKDTSFRIAHWLDDVHGYGMVEYGQFAEFCLRSGYEVPPDVYGAFPDAKVIHTGISKWSKVQNRFASGQGISFTYLDQLLGNE